MGKLNLCSYLDSVNDPDILQRRWLGGGGGGGGEWDTMHL